MKSFMIPIPRVVQLGRVGFVLALLLLFLAPDAEAQRRKSTSGKRGRAAATKQEKRKQPKRVTQKKKSSSQSAAQRSSTSRSREPRNTGNGAAQRNEVVQVSGPADLAQQTYEGGNTGASARTKRPAPPSPPLTTEQLQALTPYKREVEGVPLRGYAEPERSTQPLRPLYAEASLGMYLTAGLRAGFTGSSWPYDYSANISATTTSGFIDNASKSGISVGAKGGYIIDDGYGIFSGGHMGAEAEYRSEKYRRYALAAAPDRSVGSWNIGMDGQNSYDGTAFELYGRYRQLALADTGSVGESSLDGGVKIRVPYLGLTVGGSADLRLTNLDGTSISFGKVDGYAKYSTSILALRGGVSIGVGENSDNSTTMRIAPLAEISLFPFHGVTLTAGLSGGLSQSSLHQLLAINPYVIPDPLIQHEVERIGYSTTLRIEPAQEFALRLTGARGNYDHYSYFRDTLDALFAPNYGEATITKIIGDFYWELGSRTMVAASATFMESRLEPSGLQVPYVPKWDAEFLFTQRLASMPLSVTASARYIGQRDDVDGNRMEAVPLAGLMGRYSINKLFDVTLELNNLMNSRYELWPGYRERGLYGAVGIGIRY